MGPDETIGVTVGSYRVTAKLGQGGMGAVYLAEHPLLERKAAVKVLLPELSSHTDLVERFFHEARTTARLRHPAMVDVYDFGTLPDGRAYLIMDYLEGENLESRLRDRGALAPSQALRIARDIAVGVAVAHAEQIVHRDLKPDNVFLLPALAGTQEERVKILDFGIAKLGVKPGESRVGVTRVGALLGTPLYMSPEQCRGAGEVDARADIYSLGCILFAMLAGRPPFLSDSMGEVLGMQLMAPPPTLDSLGVTVPGGIEALVQSMLAKAPEDRPPSMVVAAENMDQLLRELATGSARNARTLAMGSRDREINTRRGRPTGDVIAPSATPVAASTNAGHNTTGTGLVSSAGTGTAPGTLAGRSISEAERPTFVDPRRKPLLIAGAALALVAAGSLIAFGLLGRGRDAGPSARTPASKSTSVSAGGAPIPNAGTKTAGVPANPPAAVQPPVVPASGAGSTTTVTPGAPGVSPPAPTAATPESLPGTTAGTIAPGATVGTTAPETARKDGLRKSAGTGARGRVLPSGAQNPAASAPAASTTPNPAGPPPPPPTPPKPGRPIYRGTQLQIEKNDPY
ncbi:MAG TPA: protein kinase [Polyangia bacterium]